MEYTRNGINDEIRHLVAFVRDVEIVYQYVYKHDTSFVNVSYLSRRFFLSVLFLQMESVNFLRNTV